ncbi:branched-chain amino acid ABC transporter permease [Pacificibacter marinus]|uniref:branched-chain amino acid ABC transporter permease n=1 Tax=Pacificibacter marinus TaxID=658057 RepID=UPI001C07CC64|nr:branched-chain amino acid ABC transporter permease [Pacificibacter marinus]MBU2867426.1 branched-chain amino acid ABC transporter permease [Pacificibacter marinus]
MKKESYIVLPILAVLCIALPLFYGDRYVIGQATVALIWATVALNWNLVFSMAGVFSLAQLAFFAVGGYTLAVLNGHFGISTWIALPVAGLVTMMVGMLSGAACLRLRGAYVALLTLALSQALYLLIVTDTACFRTEGGNCIPFTGGSRGLSRYEDFGFREFLPYPVSHIGDYGLAAALLIVSLFVAILVSRSPFGLGFRSIRDNEQYARARGLNRFRFQLSVFAISAAFTGMAGALYAGHFRVMGPNVLRLDVMLFVFAMIVVGGGLKIWGPLLGAAIITVLREVSVSFDSWQPTILGGIMLVVILLAPQGVSGLLALVDPRQRAGSRLERRKREGI